MEEICLLRVIVTHTAVMVATLKEIKAELEEPVDEWKKGYEEDAG